MAERLSLFAKLKRKVAFKARLAGLERRVDFFIASIVASVINLLTKIEALNKLIIVISQKISLTKTIYDNKNKKDYIFHTPNPRTLKRARTFFVKEPRTLEWIDTFNSDDVLYDIGANIGVYTIYAGVNKKAENILAFEPDSLNYAILNKNVFINGLYDRVACYNIAFSDSSRLDYLYLSVLDPGSSCHNFGYPNEYVKKLKGTLKQGSISYTLDTFIDEFDPPFPNHIKIDVDGLEKEIIVGALKTLQEKRLKSVLVEIDDNLAGSGEIINFIQSSGLKLISRKHTCFSGTGTDSNYLFVRQLG